MAIIRVQLRDPKPGFGDGDGTSWSLSKDGRGSQLIERGQFLILTGPSMMGKRIRIPMGNVAGITEDDVVETTKAGS